MSFDVFLIRFVAGQPAEADRTRVWSVLRSAAFEGPDKYNFYVVKFPDETAVEFYATGLDGAESFTSCSFSIRGMSDLLVQFIFDVARVGDMVILPAMEDFVPILTSVHQQAELPHELQRDYPEPVVCTSSGDLAALLSHGYQGWRRYGDYVVNNSHSSTN